MMMKHLAWIALLAACTDFETIDRDVCGNGLLEAGEDCDSSDPSCVSCSVSCQADADCPGAAYACGIDGLCHAAGGALGQPQSGGTFQADEVRITDIDHDGVGDAFGLARTSLLVRFGDPTGRLDESVSFVTPTQTGPASFGDLDGDGSLDVTLTTRDGLISYASTFGELAPLVVNSRVIDQQSGEALDLRKVFFFGVNVFTALLVDPGTNAAAIIAIDNNAPTPQLQFHVPCGTLTGPKLQGAKIDIYNVSRRQDAAFDAVIAITSGSGASGTFCVVAMHRDAPNLITGAVPAITFTNITPAGVTPTVAPVLADIDTDNDPCPGLVFLDSGLSAPVYWEGALVTGRCAMLPAAADNPKTLPEIPAPAGAQVIGRVPVTPTVTFVASDALITDEGIYPNLFGYYFFGVFHTSRDITHFGTGDFDGDGAVDVVVGSEGEEELDILFRVGSQAGFNQYKIDTATGISTLTTGDFDGNRIDDIIYSERLDGYARLLVAFGTRDRPLPAQRVATFSDVVAVDRVSFADSVDTLAIAEDLVVFQPPLPGTTEQRITLFAGSPQRTLMPYFDPRDDLAGTQTLLRGAVIGDFTSSAGATQYTDLIAIGPVASTAVAGPRTRAFRMPGTPDGLDTTATPGLAMPELIDCSRFDVATALLCLDTARYFAFPTAERHDVVIGIDREQRAAMLDPWGTQMLTAVALDALMDKLPADTIPTSIHAADLDGDGARELLVAMAPEPASGATGAIVWCTMTDGIPGTCEDLVPAIEEAAAAAAIPIGQCYDATVARLSHGEAGNDIVVACRGEGTTLFRIHGLDAEQAIERIATLAAPVFALAAGDVTGDRVDDLIVLGGETVSTLIVYPQCTTRDLACIGGGR